MFLPGPGKDGYAENTTDKDRSAKLPIKRGPKP